VFSVVGLVFDLVGAVALVLGLFTYAEPLVPGWRRSPTDYAHDAVFGCVGAFFLVCGFVLQALYYLGVHPGARHWVIAVVAAVVLVIAVLVAWATYGLLYIAFHAVEARRIAAAHPQVGYSVRRQRRDVRFWRQEPIPPEPADKSPQAT
jgi:hypothetical protein